MSVFMAVAKANLVSVILGLEEAVRRFKLLVAPDDCLYLAVLFALVTFT